MVEAAAAARAAGGVLVWRNYTKAEGEGPRRRRVRGMRRTGWSCEAAGESVVRGRIILPKRRLEYYGRRVWKRVLERQRVHDLKYAF
ncbi:MAG: hypothetical protein IPO18_02120 [bacterium]|nr:hypothetical protein [bacterium]